MEKDNDDLQPLCHRHFVPMSEASFFLRDGDEKIQVTAYSCPEPECSVHYISSQGYFLLDRDGADFESADAPRSHCEYDGAPMFLVQIPLGNTMLRLWECPDCQRHTVHSPQDHPITCDGTSPTTDPRRRPSSG